MILKPLPYLSFNTIVLITLLANRECGHYLFPPGVIATGTMGPTNPPEPTLGTPINQTSVARLLSVNSIDVRDNIFHSSPILYN
jgi:hypothetical protein